MQDTAIGWCTHTLNFWSGCTKVSSGCDNCYAEGIARRFKSVEWGPHAERKRTSERNREQAFKWNARAAAAGEPCTVFTNSMADFFDNAVSPDWRADAWDTVRATPHLTWLILTKRPGNIPRMLPPGWGQGWRHVILGTSCENQEETDRRVPLLRAAPAARRFLSCEPLLGPVVLWSRDPAGGVLRGPGVDPTTGRPGVDWVIAGGESGARARPMQPAWPRALREQCEGEGVAFFFKQWGDWIPAEEAEGAPATMTRVGVKHSGATLDGCTHTASPGPCT